MYKIQSQQSAENCLQREYRIKKEEKESNKKIWQIVGQKHDETLKEAIELARKGDPRGQYILAKFLQYGWKRFKVDYPKALDFYQAAAEQGHAGACHDLADIYTSGNPKMRIAQNLALARHYANLGLSEKSYNIGMKYDTSGHNQAQNLEKLKILQQFIDVSEKMNAKSAPHYFKKQGF